MGPRPSLLRCASRALTGFWRGTSAHHLRRTRTHTGSLPPIPPIPTRTSRPLMTGRLRRLLGQPHPLQHLHRLPLTMPNLRTQPGQRGRPALARQLRVIHRLQLLGAIRSRNRPVQRLGLILIELDARNAGRLQRGDHLHPQLLARRLPSPTHSTSIRPATGTTPRNLFAARRFHAIVAARGTCSWATRFGYSKHHGSAIRGARNMAPTRGLGCSARNRSQRAVRSRLDASNGGTPQGKVLTSANGAHSIRSANIRLRTESLGCEPKVPAAQCITVQRSCCAATSLVCLRRVAVEGRAGVSLLGGPVQQTLGWHRWRAYGGDLSAPAGAPVPGGRSSQDGNTSRAGLWASCLPCRRARRLPRGGRRTRRAARRGSRSCSWRRTVTGRPRPRGRCAARRTRGLSG